jgi:hypothetical protein
LTVLLSKEGVVVTRVPDRVDAALELEALVRLAGARDLAEHILRGDVWPTPWIGGVRRLVEKAERLFEAAA